MLLGSNYSIEKTLVFNFSFDNGENKTVKLGLGDIAEITYNAGRTRETITGTVTRLEAGNHMATSPRQICQENIVDNCDKEHWWIMVDGSMYNKSKLCRIPVNKILDVTLLVGADTIQAINSPLGQYNITDFRLNGGMLQLSIDNQRTWLNVGMIMDSDVTVEDPAAQELADKISAIIPGCVNPKDKTDLILALLDIINASVTEGIGKAQEYKQGELNALTNAVIAQIKDSNAFKECECDDHTDQTDLIQQIIAVMKEQGLVATSDEAASAGTGSKPGSEGYFSDED